MSDKTKKFIVNVLAGVVAEDSLPDFEAMEDDQVTAYAADVAKKQRQKLSSEFKGQYYTTATKEILRGLHAEGVLEAEQVSEFSTLKFEELTTQLSNALKTKQVASMSESQKQIAEKIEDAKRLIKSQYDTQLNELNGKLSGYEQREYEGKKITAIKSALPKGFTPTDVQLKALNGLIGSEVDIKFTDSGEPNLFYKGTDTVFGYNDRQILGLNDIVPKYLKELGVWSEKAKPELKDYTGFTKQEDKKDITIPANGATNDRLKAAQEFKEMLDKQQQ